MTTNQLATAGRPNHKAQSHRKIVGDLLVAVQEQEDIMKQLTKDFEYFRGKYKNSLGYGNGTGCYLADVGEETIDVRSYIDLGNGVILQRQQPII